jgi:hypothetical protein
MIGRLDPFKPAVVALAVVAALGIGTIYNLSAVKFLGSFAAFHAISLLVSRHEWRGRLAISAAAVTCVALATLLHPRFMGMVANAGHSGGIRVLPWMALGGAAALLIASSALFWLDHRSRSIRVLVAVGLGISLAAYAQYAALLLFGLGSPYAVSKHGYLIGLLFAVAAGALVSSLLARGRPTIAPGIARGALAVTYAAIGCILALGKPGPVLRPFTTYQANLREMIGSSVVRDLEGNTLSSHSGFSPQLNYAAAVGDLKIVGWSPIGVEQLDFPHIYRRVPVPLSSRYAVVSIEQAKDLPPDCLLDRSQDHSLAVVRSHCVFRAD